MGQSLPWSRRLGVALAAAVLCFLTFGPSLDALVCHDEAGLNAAAAERPASATTGDASHEQGHDEAACAHGHCHHGGPYAPPSHMGAGRPGPARAAEHGLSPTRLPTAEPKFPLMRPPRA